MSALPRPPAAAAALPPGVRPELGELLALRHALIPVRTRPHATTFPASGGHRPLAAYGRGLEFAETRPWQPGDDRRAVDWRQLARHGQPYTKRFHAEHDRQVFIAVDRSPAMDFGTRVAFKSVVACRAAALLAWQALAAGERVGGGRWGPERHRLLAASPRQTGVLALLGALVSGAGAADAGGGFDALLTALLAAARHDDAVHLLSDFRDLDARSEAHLIRLGRRGPLILWSLDDPLETAPPNQGQLSLAACGRRIDLADPRQRAALSAPTQARRQRLRALAARAGAEWRPLSTADDLPTRVLADAGRRR